MTTLRDIFNACAGAIAGHGLSLVSKNPRRGVGLFNYVFERRHQ